MIRSTDINGNVSFYRYDNFGRIRAIGMPGDPNDKPTKEFFYELKSPVSRLIKRYRSKQGGPLVREEISCFDGLARTISSMVKLKSDQYLVSTHFAYNARGRRAVMWQNYFQRDSKCRNPSKRVGLSAL